jgi:hypothetical protein
MLTNKSGSELPTFPSEREAVVKIREMGQLNSFLSVFEFSSDDLAVIVFNIFLEVSAEN